MKKVLIVENDSIIAEGTKSILELSGYIVTAICRSGTDAISSIKTVLPDVILMDISLDGIIDGISTAKIIQQEHSLPVVYISQYADQQVFQNVKNTFPSNYLSKPYDNDELLKAIDMALATPAQNNTNDSLYSRVDDGVFIYTKDGEYEKLLYEEILYIEAAGSSTLIYYEHNKNKQHKKHYTISLSSNHVVKKLNCSRLFKVNRSVYINMDKLHKINSSHVFVGDYPIKMSDDFKEDILNNRLIRMKK